MNRAEAVRSLDAAFDDGMKKLFDVLVQNLLNKTPDSIGNFHNGLALRDEAYSLARNEIEKIFPEDLLT